LKQLTVYDFAVTFIDSGVAPMSSYGLEQGFSDPSLNATTTASEFQSWVMEFPVRRTQKLKQLLEKHNLEAIEFADVTSVLKDIPDPVVQQAQDYFDIYTTTLKVKDTTSGKAYDIPFVVVFSKGGRASSSELAIPMSIAEAYVMDHQFAQSGMKVIGVADLTKTRLSASMSSEQVQAIVQMYRHDNFYKQVTIHFLGIGFINTLLGIVGRLAQDSRVISSKVLVVNNMDSAMNSITEMVVGLIKSSNESA
jgi:hypothetical protein